MEFDMVEVLELDLVEVIAHERSLMLAIVAHLPFPSLVSAILDFSQPSNILSLFGRLPSRAPAHKFTNSSLHMVSFPSKY